MFYKRKGLNKIVTRM